MRYQSGRAVAAHRRRTYVAARNHARGDRSMTRGADPARLAAGLAVLAAIALSGAARAAAAEGGGVALASHRAIYDLKLADVRGRRQLSAVQGRIVYDFSGSACEGYALQFRRGAEPATGGGKGVAGDLRPPTGEEGAAKNYPFNFQNYLSDQLVASVEGRAERGSRAIAVNRAEPSHKKFDLDAAVVFP